MTDHVSSSLAQDRATITLASTPMVPTVDGTRASMVFGRRWFPGPVSGTPAFPAGAAQRPISRMARKKLLRFAELHEMDNVVDGQTCDVGWFERTFGREAPVVLELGCGRGEYTLALARSRPNLGVVGVDRNGARLWKGAGAALAEGLTNAFFLRSRIEDLEDHVPPGRVDAIWLPFPDPLPKHSQAKHRLLSPVFLKRYRKVLRARAAIHLRTDDAYLVGFAEQSVGAVGGHILTGVDGVAADLDEGAAIQTTYEKRYRDEGRTIYDRRFRLD